VKAELPAFLSAQIIKGEQLLEWLQHIFHEKGKELPEDAFDIRNGHGLSMLPTLPQRTITFGVNVSYLPQAVTRGDLISLWDPEKPVKRLIKRVIAVEGDWVKVDPRFGRKRWKVNPKALYLDRSSVLLPKRGDTGTQIFDVNANQVTETSSGLHVEIPEGYIWVVGDNKADSGDSREFGPVPVSSVLHKQILMVCEGVTY
jgi:signal peptidase I